MSVGPCTALAKKIGVGFGKQPMADGEERLLRGDSEVGDAPEGANACKVDERPKPHLAVCMYVCAYSYAYVCPYVHILHKYYLSI